MILEILGDVAFGDVMASSGLGNSDWFKERFGDVSPSVAEALILAGRIAHETSADTKATSGLRTDEPYGATFWQILAIETYEQISQIQGVRGIRPRGSRFRLPVIGGTTVYAVKCAARSGINADNLTVRWSQFRETLLGEVDRRPDEPLPLDEWQSDESDLAEPRSPGEAVVLVTYVASDRGGLERIYIGDGYLDPNGRVVWLRYEQLAVKVDLDIALGAPLAVTGRFDEAPLQNLDLSLREDDADTKAESK